MGLILRRHLLQMRTKKLNMKWQTCLSTDSRFCLQFVEITSLAKYEPGVWNMNEPKYKSRGASLARSKTNNKCLWTTHVHFSKQ